MIQDQQTPPSARLPVSVGPDPDEVRRQAAQRIIVQHVVVHAGIGALPVGLPAQVIGGLGSDLVMIGRLVRCYDGAFDTEQGRVALTLLAGNLGVTIAGDAVGRGFALLVPGLRGWAEFAGTALALGAFTHAVGTLVMDHYEAGGNRRIDLRRMTDRDEWRQRYADSKQFVRDRVWPSRAPAAANGSA